MKSVSEILEDVSKLKTEKERVAALQMANSLVLQTVLRGAFDPAVQWLLPAGAPPYKPCDPRDSEGQLQQECRRLYLFVEGGNPGLKQNRREQLFIEMLEALHPRDAELLCAVKDKALPASMKVITKELVERALPGLW